MHAEIMGAAGDPRATSQAERSGAIRLEGLTKVFGAHAATRDVNLSVYAGELVTLLGPSGSGKTTTLMMVAGHEAPSSGQIFVNGHDVTHKPPHLRRIGMVFQHYAIFPHMTVADNIAFPLKMYKTDKAKRGAAIQTVIDMVRLAGLESRYPNQLSGGQLQRVALARALVFGPSILLMDEPLSALDKQLRESMQMEIRRLQQDLGIPTLYVTHDQHEALVLSDRIAVFNNGGVVQVGTPLEIYEHPRNRFVAEFIGESNFIDGLVQESGQRMTRVTIGPDLHVTATGSAQFLPSERVTVAVRPEAIEIGLPAATNDMNVVSGEVQQIVFTGNARRIWVRSHGAHVYMVSQGNSGNCQHLETGQKVTLSWKWSRTSIIQQEEACNG